MPSKDAPIFLFYQDSLLMLEKRLPFLSQIEKTTIDWKVFPLTQEYNLYAGCLPTPDAITPFQLIPLRSALPQLNEELQLLALKAKSLLRWDKMHQFCGQCGQPTHRLAHEWAKFCESCQETFYPRLSPSIIVLIHDGDKILLGRKPNFLPNVYSCLAGFIEPGETAEMALHREVKEEVNLHVNQIQYFGSQAWPFPDSFMLGYFAAYESGTLQVDTAELEDAQWFHYRHLPTLPTQASIAYDLIAAFCKRAN